MWMKDDSGHWSITCPAARVVQMTHGCSCSIASNNYISESPLLGVRKWCKMLQMKGPVGVGGEAVLILMQQIAVKDLEILGSIYEKGWFIRL
jgi:hypothetical protein